MKSLDNKTPNISRVIIENFIERLRYIPMPHEMYEAIIALVKLCVKEIGELITSDTLNLRYDEPEHDFDEAYEDFEDIFS